MSSSLGPLVSIVITNYNYEDYLRASIDSALAQTYPRIDIIVVDDGSTDRSADIIRSYGPDIIGIITENGGQGAATNVGFARSSGEIVIFLDADDVLYPTAVAEVVQAWSSDVSKIHFSLQSINASGKKLDRRWPDETVSGDEALRRVSRYGAYPSPPSSGNAYSRGYLGRVMPMEDPKWRINADTYLICLAPLYGKVKALTETLGGYRIHNRNQSEVADVTLTRVRTRICSDVSSFEAIKRHADITGVRVHPRALLRVPGHCKARLASLKIDPDGHPLSGDTVTGLMAAGVVSAWAHHRRNPAGRMATSVAFVVLAALPGAWIKQNLRLLMRKQDRRAAVTSSIPRALTSLMNSRKPGLSS